MKEKLFSLLNCRNTKPHRFKYYQLLPLFLVLSICFGSCKKEVLLKAQQSQKSDIYRKSPIENIDYNKFLASIDLNKTGILKQCLQINSDSAKHAIYSSKTEQEFNLDTKSVKVLTRQDTVSYIISLKPKTPRAQHFENLTIQLIGNNVSAFLTTYLPTKEWIEDWKTVKRMAFKGQVLANKINLANTPYNPIDISQQTANLDKHDNTNIIINDVKVSLAPGECEVYDIYEWVPVQCSTGDWPGDCIWETQPFTMPEGQYPPGYIVVHTSVVNCAMPEMPYGGGGGGGGSTPNPPSDYNPCEDGPVPDLSEVKSSFKILVLPPTDCDPVVPQPQEPVYPYEVQSILDFYNLQGIDRTYVVSNQQFAIALYSQLEDDGFTLEGKTAALMTIKAAATGTFSTANYNYAYTSISSALPNPQLMTAQMFSMYLSIQCAIIKAEHPEYPTWRLYWEASKEILHLVLDGAGLVPVIGEVADLANGVLYTIEGDGVNATLSYASAIPIAGWFASGAKFAKKTITLVDGSKTTLKWVVKIGQVISFGNRGQLRKILNLAVGDLRQAHHVIPWAQQTHRTIQKAAKSKKAFHMNSVLNGIPLNTIVHQGSHANYDQLVLQRLESISPNLTPEATADAIEAIISQIKNAMLANPNTHVNNLIF